MAISSKGSRVKNAPLGVLSGQQLGLFTALVALAAILADAAIGHGLTWENDPYWTYWITKTFLIATVFGIGTALIGMGRARGAIITAVHTLILTIYYWTLSPVGLPSHPHWLDLEHTWLTGLPIHFGVIYLGYLMALWVWRNVQLNSEQNFESARSLALNALGFGALIVLVAGGLSNLALGEFSGVTWYIVRLLITVPFLIFWWGAVGRNLIANIIGAVTLALIWATYSQFLGPVGLPDSPLRIFSEASPPATVHWQSYNQIWLISLPIYIASMIGILTLASRRLDRQMLKPFAVLAAILTLIVLIAMAIIPNDSHSAGRRAKIQAQGPVFVETGPFYSDKFTKGNGKISLNATDTGDRVSPLPPHDELIIHATIQVENHNFLVKVGKPMVEDPAGRHTTWWGVGFDADHHGKSGIGTSELPNIKSELAVFGIGEVYMDGQLVASGVPVHAMTAKSGFPNNAKLELDVGDKEMTPLPGIPNGHLRVLWQDYQGEIPASHTAQYIGGNLVLLGLIAGGLIINNQSSALFNSGKNTKRNREKLKK
jgi:hypothetical protein